MHTLTKWIYKCPIRWRISLLTLAALLCSFGGSESLAATGGLEGGIRAALEVPDEPLALELIP